MNIDNEMNIIEWIQCNEYDGLYVMESNGIEWNGMYIYNGMECIYIIECNGMWCHRM